jgi:NAD(P)-dependent dehydrogenase (short-subunit alcohol dehydrogenase family)
VSDLAGKVAIVTGAALGIGRATAKLLAGDGVRVIVADIADEHGRQVVEEIQAAGGEARFVHTDVGSTPPIIAVIEDAVATYGHLDLMVNNAYWNARGTVEELDEADWDKAMNVMLKAIYTAGKYAFPHMRAAGGGSMVNIASVHGYNASNKYAVYDAAKAGVINLTRQMAIDYGHDNIRVNAVCPGWILSGTRQPSPIALANAAKLYPLGRPGQPIDIAKVVRFLLSDEAAFVTGHALVADGGLTAQLQDSAAELFYR